MSAACLSKFLLSPQKPSLFRRTTLGWVSFLLSIISLMARPRESLSSVRVRMYLTATGAPRHDALYTELQGQERQLQSFSQYNVHVYIVISNCNDVPEGSGAKSLPRRAPGSPKGTAANLFLQLDFIKVNFVGEGHSHAVIPFLAARTQQQVGRGGREQCGGFCRGQAVQQAARLQVTHRQAAGADQAAQVRLGAAGAACQRGEERGALAEWGVGRRSFSVREPAAVASRSAQRGEGRCRGGDGKVARGGLRGG